MAKHDQKVEQKHMVCSNCKAGRCEECVDILRILYTDKMICECTRKNHNGEPRDQQILDPESGTVYGPGLTVSEDGEVKRSA